MTEKYFDNAIATKPCEKARLAMRDAETLWQCLSAPYQRSSQLRIQLQEWHRFLQQFFGFRDSDKLTFTSSSNEAITQIFNGVYKETIAQMGKNQIVHLYTDEAPILLATEDLKDYHVVAKAIDVSSTGGVLTKELLAEHITARTALVSISWAHGLTGVINPLWELAELCEEEGVLMHVDATEVIGKLYFHFQDLPIDYMTVDGSRIHAPYGTGILLTKRGSDLSPLIPDVLQQDGMRGGIFNTPGFAGFTAAVEELGIYADHMCVEMIRLRDLFETLLLEKVPELQPLFQEKERLPHVSVITFPGIHAEHMQHALSFQKLYASRGGGIHQALDKVLEACGYPKEIALASLSFSFSRETTEEEIESAVSCIAETYTRLAKGSLDYAEMSS